jgi:hypothetical protein
LLSSTTECGEGLLQPLPTAERANRFINPSLSLIDIVKVEGICSSSDSRKVLAESNPL